MNAQFQIVVEPNKSPVAVKSITDKGIIVGKSENFFIVQHEDKTGFNYLYPFEFNHLKFSLKDDKSIDYSCSSELQEILYFLWKEGEMLINVEDIPKPWDQHIKKMVAVQWDNQELMLLFRKYMSHNDACELTDELDLKYLPPIKRT